MADIKDLGPQLDKLLSELERRAARAAKNRKYVEGAAPVPKAVESAKLTQAYDKLTGMSPAPWANLVVASKLDRLEVGGIRTGDKDADRRLWREVWQANGLDAESKLAHDSVLTNGRAFATIWPDEDGNVEVVYDGADQVVIQYLEGRHRARHRVAALRRWVDADDERARITLYRRDALYKFVESKEQKDGEMRVRAGGKWWEPRLDDRTDETDNWPLENPYGVVPVVELATNRKLGPGAFPYARGEFEHCYGVLDRISLLTFLGLVVAIWMGFPLRYAVGLDILKDDDGNPIPPFDAKPDSVVQLEDPQAKVGQLDAADRANLSIFPELAQLAYVTHTPLHYVPHETGISNISADTITALEGAMHAQVSGTHQPYIGEGHEEVFRVGGLMLDAPIQVPAEAELAWRDHESRSLAERADAAVKIAQIEGMPALFVAEEYLNLSQEALERLRAARTDDALSRLLAAAAKPADEPAPDGEVAAALNGAGG